MKAGRTEPIARQLKDRGLATPALLLLDAHRPLRPLMGLTATFLAPLIRPLLGDAALRVEQAVESDEAYQELVGQLREEVEG